MLKCLPSMRTVWIALLLMPSATCSQASALYDHTSLRAGYGYTRTGNAQNIWLNTTPLPGLENNYSSGGLHNGSFLLAVSVDKTLKTYHDYTGLVGVSAMFLRNPFIQGTVQPMVNVAPDFDTLTYTYDMNSYLLLLSGKASKDHLLEQLGAYIELNAGFAVNNLFNYTENSPINSTAAPMLKPFGNHSVVKFAYAAGVGLLYRFPQAFTFSVGYLYVNTGSAVLETTPIQQTTSHLHFSPINSQFVVFTLSI